MFFPVALSFAAVQCPELTPPEGGSMYCSSPLGPSRYRSTCVFACDEGFVPAGSSSDALQCEASGRWNASQPSCVGTLTCFFYCLRCLFLQRKSCLIFNLLVQVPDVSFTSSVAMECPAPEVPTSGRISCSLPLSSPASPETPHPLGMVCTFTLWWRPRVGRCSQHGVWAPRPVDLLTTHVHRYQYVAFLSAPVVVLTWSQNEMWLNYSFHINC